MDRRLSRRKSRTRLALAAGALVLAIPGVAACGFNYATDRSNTIVNGSVNQDGDVDILNALVVSAEQGSGTFVATLANNTDEPISLTSLDFGSDSTVAVAAFDPIEVAPRGAVNLADGQGIKVSGSFTTGQFVTVDLGFDNGQSTTMKVPVVLDDDEYTGLDNGTGAPSPSTSDSPSATASPS